MVILDIYVQNITCSEYHLCIMPIHNCKQDCMCCHQCVRLAQDSLYFLSVLGRFVHLFCIITLETLCQHSIQYIPSSSSMETTVEEGLVVTGPLGVKS